MSRPTGNGTPYRNDQFSSIQTANFSGSGEAYISDTGAYAEGTLGSSTVTDTANVYAKSRVIGGGSTATNEIAGNNFAKADSGNRKDGNLFYGRKK